MELASAKAANVAAFELANTLRAQHAKECARHSAELAKVKDVAKKALDAVGIPGRLTRSRGLVGFTRR